MTKCKAIIGCIIVMFGIGAGYSAVKVAPGLDLGIIIANVSEPTDQIYNDFGIRQQDNMKAGFAGCVTADISFNKIFSIVPGIGVSVRGANVSASYADSTGYGWKETFMYNLVYLDIPLLAKVRFNIGRIIPFVALGPDLGILLSAKENGTYSSGDYSDNFNDDMMNSSNPLDLGLIMKAGLELKL
jgi:Outer membrane protein beta-barrel domain